jgi:hypothetical protein
MEPGTTLEDKKFIGSVLIFEADQIDDVRKRIESDVYYTEGVVSASFISKFVTIMSSGHLYFSGSSKSCRSILGICLLAHYPSIMYST